MAKKQNIKTTAILITVIAVICKLIGFVREIILADYYGTTYVVDAYLTSTMIPGVFFGWLSSFAVGYIPLFYEVKKNKAEKDVYKFTNTILTFSLLVSFLCGILACVYSDLFVKLAAPGFSGAVLDLTKHYFKIAIWIIVTNVPIKILTAYLNCKDRFLKSNLSTLVVGITEIIIIVLSKQYGMEILIWGVVLADFFQMVVLIAFSKKEGYKFYPCIEISDELKMLIKMVIPIFIGNMLIEINSYFDQVFASFLDEGRISAMHYAVKIRVFVYYIFNTAISTIIFPVISKQIVNSKFEEAATTMRKCIRLIIILFIPITIGGICLSVPLISVFFERGKFNGFSVILTAAPFCMYILGLLPLALRDVMTKLFYAMKQTKIVTLTSLTSIIINIGFNFMFFRYLGHVGLALATTLSFACTMPIMIYHANKKIGKIFDRSIIVLIIKIFIASCIMAVFTIYTYKFTNKIILVESGELTALVISISLGALIYYLVLNVMKIDEICLMNRKLLTKFKVK